MLPVRLRTAALCLLLACGATSQPIPTAPEPEPEPPESTRLARAVYFVPGEIMKFEFRFRGITVGRSVLVVGEPGTVDGRRVVIVRSEIETVGVGKLVKVVRDDTRSWLEVATGLPIKHLSDMVFGDVRLVVDSFAAPGRAVIDYRRNGKKGHRRGFKLPPGEIALDLHGALGAMRAWQPEPGDKTRFYGLSGRRVWECELVAGKRETIRTGMGLYPAIRIEGWGARLTHRMRRDERRQPRTFTLWISDDANRLPLRFIARTEHGELGMELIEYRHPDRAVSRR